MRTHDGKVVLELERTTAVAVINAVYDRYIAAAAHAEGRCKATERIERKRKAEDARLAWIEVVDQLSEEDER